MVNSELFKAAGLFATGRDLLQQGHCAKVRPVVEQIVSLMTVPLVQGTLRYAYKVGHVANDQSAKNAAEGSTFAAAKCTDPTSSHIAWTPIVAAVAAKTVAGDKKNQVSVQVKIAGEVGTYNTPTMKAALEASMATVAGVEAKAVTVTVIAGSVILDFLIITADPAAAVAVKAKVTTALKDTALASTALGVTVEAVPTVAVVSPPKKDDEDGLSTGAVVGIAVGAVVGLLLIGGIAFKVMS